MDLDEQSNSGFPVALSAPGPSTETEEGVAASLALSLEPYAGARMHAPGLAKKNVDWGVAIFSLRCTQALDVYPPPLSTSSTTH